MTEPKILVTGANGQIGAVLTEALEVKYGRRQVIASDIRRPQESDPNFEILDVLDASALNACIAKHGITEIFHLAAILSAKGEQNPRQAWEVNMDGLFNVLEVAREKQLKVFFPSSIAVFGGRAPKAKTPQFTLLEPRTVYGISKVAGEHWCRYYHSKFGVDVRSLRYSGIVGHQSLPGGGTTDYAVEIFHEAIKKGSYECFIEEHTALPMMFMDDAIRATVEIMSVPSEKIKIRTGYNLTALSFSPGELAEAIRRHIPDFEITYRPDYRQQIAASWPNSIDDSAARKDWGWKPRYDLAAMTSEMIEQLRKTYSSRIQLDSSGHQS